MDPQKNTIDLINDIQRLGIHDSAFLNQVDYIADLRLPYFELSYTTAYPDGKLTVELHIRQNVESGLYELSGFTGRFLKEIPFGPGIVNDIDVLDLDTEMGKVNWMLVLNRFEQGEAVLEGHASIKDVLEKLHRLAANEQEGIRLQQLLKIKHWYGTSLHDPALDQRKSELINEQYFQAQYPLEENTNYLYHLLSGKFDQYIAQLANIGFGGRYYLKRMLCYNENDFALNFYRVQPEAILQYTIPFTLKDTRYDIDNYKAKCTEVPEIRHGVYYGINTQELELKMMPIDWLDEESHYQYDKSDGEIRFTEGISEIISQLQYQLQSHPEGNIISCQLQLKYWAESPDFAGIIDEEAWNYLETLPSKTVEVPSGITAEQADHLIKEQAVYLEDRDKFTGLWYHTLAGNDNDGTLRLECDQGFSKTGLERRLQQLPCGEDQVSSALKRILNGENAEITLNNGQSIIITAAPILRELYMYNTEGRPLHPFLTTTAKQETFQKPKSPNRRP